MLATLGVMSRPVRIVLIALTLLLGAAAVAFAVHLSMRSPATPPARVSGLDLSLRPVARGFDGALGVVQAPGETRLLVIERRGVVRPVIKGRPGPAWLDLRDRVGSDGMEQGLLGLAFAPDYARSGRFYVNYTGRDGDTRIVELRARPGASRVDPRTARTVVVQAQPYDNHNGGSLAFGTDGMLYIGLGDGGAAGDPQNRAQDRSTLLGKILRIDPRRTADGRPYSIPSDNPFVRTPGARGEIWATGLRNPWRIAVDRQTGYLWIADVGQNAREEINVAGEGGLDFGWRKREGTLEYKGGPVGEREQRPVAEYSHDQGCSVTGGYVYRGRAIPELQGQYLYADWCSGRAWALPATGGKPGEITRALGKIEGVTSFGEDRAGNIYVVTPDAVRRVIG